MATVKIFLAGHVLLARPTNGPATLLFLGGEHSPTLAIPCENLTRVDPSFPRPPGHFVGGAGRLHLLADIAGCALAWRGASGVLTFNTPTLLDLSEQSGGTVTLPKANFDFPQVSATWTVDRGVVRSSAQTAEVFNLIKNGSATPVASFIDTVLEWEVGPSETFRLEVNTGARTAVFDLAPAPGSGVIELSAYSFCGWPARGNLGDPIVLDLYAHSALLGHTFSIGTPKTKIDTDLKTCPPSSVTLV